MLRRSSRSSLNSVASARGAQFFDQARRTSAKISFRSDHDERKVAQTPQARRRACRPTRRARKGLRSAAWSRGPSPARRGRRARTRKRAHWQPPPRRQHRRDRHRQVEILGLRDHATVPRAARVFSSSATMTCGSSNRKACGLRCVMRGGLQRGIASARSRRMWAGGGAARLFGDGRTGAQEAIIGLVRCRQPLNPANSAAGSSAGRPGKAATSPVPSNVSFPMLSPLSGVPMIACSLSRPRATVASRVARTAASATTSICAPETWRVRSRASVMRDRNRSSRSVGWRGAGDRPWSRPKRMRSMRGRNRRSNARAAGANESRIAARGAFEVLHGIGPALNAASASTSRSDDRGRAKMLA